MKQSSSIFKTNGNNIYATADDYNSKINNKKINDILNSLEELVKNILNQLSEELKNIEKIIESEENLNLDLSKKIQDIKFFLQNKENLSWKDFIQQNRLWIISNSLNELLLFIAKNTQDYKTYEKIQSSKENIEKIFKNLFKEINNKAKINIDLINIWKEMNKIFDKENLESEELVKSIVFKIFIALWDSFHKKDF